MYLLLFTIICKLAFTQNPSFSGKIDTTTIKMNKNSLNSEVKEEPTLKISEKKTSNSNANETEEKSTPALMNAKKKEDD